MATITGLTADRMIEMENATIIDGQVVGNDLILETRGGTPINAGNVRGPIGPGGSGFVVCTSTTRPSLIAADEGVAIYETDTDLTRFWTGTRWRLQERIICTSTTRPTSLVAEDEGVAIYETDNNTEYYWTGTAWQPFSVIPVGACIEYFGNVEPFGWKFPNGQTLPRAAYPALFALLGTSYGAGDGTTFGLPDKRQRVGVMAGGTYAMGAVGGTATVQLVEAEIPSHSHGLNGAGAALSTISIEHFHYLGTDSVVSTGHAKDAGAHQHYVGAAGGPGPTNAFGVVGGVESDFTSYAVSSNGTHYHNLGGYTGWSNEGGSPGTSHSHTISGNTGTKGSSQPHENRQPYLVCNSLMRVI